MWFEWVPKVSRELSFEKLATSAGVHNRVSERRDAPFVNGVVPVVRPIFSKRVPFRAFDPRTDHLFAFRAEFGA